MDFREVATTRFRVSRFAIRDRFSRFEIVFRTSDTARGNAVRIRNHDEFQREAISTLPPRTPYWQAKCLLCRRPCLPFCLFTVPRMTRFPHPTLPKWMIKNGILI